MSDKTWPAAIVENGKITIVGVALLRNGHYSLIRDTSQDDADEPPEGESPPR